MQGVFPVSQLTASVSPPPYPAPPTTPTHRARALAQACHLLSWRLGGVGEATVGEGLVQWQIQAHWPHTGHHHCPETLELSLGSSGSARSPVPHSYFKGPVVPSGSSAPTTVGYDGTPQLLTCRSGPAAPALRRRSSDLGAPGPLRTRACCSLDPTAPPPQVDPPSSLPRRQQEAIPAPSHCPPDRTLSLWLPRSPALPRQTPGKRSAFSAFFSPAHKPL